MAHALVSGEIKFGAGPTKPDVLSVFVKADKGAPEEAEELEAMRLFVLRLMARGIRHETFTRNTPRGDKVDQVRIYL